MGRWPNQCLRVERDYTFRTAEYQFTLQLDIPLTEKEASDLTKFLETTNLEEACALLLEAGKNIEPSDSAAAILKAGFAQKTEAGATESTFSAT